MKNLLICASLVALVGCGGGGGGGGADSPFVGARTGSADYFASGNGTSTPTTSAIPAAGAVQKSGSFSINVQRVVSAGASPDKIVGKIKSSGDISSATLTFIAPDGTSETIIRNGTGTASLVGQTLTVTFQFPETVGEANPRRYVLTLAPS